MSSRRKLMCPRGSPSFLPQYSGDTCPAPMTFTALGETVEFKFDFICDFLSIMSFFVIFSSTIGAFRIAFAS